MSRDLGLRSSDQRHRIHDTLVNVELSRTAARILASRPCPTINDAIEQPSRVRLLIMDFLSRPKVIFIEWLKKWIVGLVQLFQPLKIFLSQPVRGGTRPTDRGRKVSVFVTHTS